MNGSRSACCLKRAGLALSLMYESLDRTEFILGCILGGAIGDAFGGARERAGDIELSDDTQLTLATCESITAAKRVDPERLAAHFVHWFRERRLTGLGSSTLKALRDLDAGAHWALSGGQGEMAAGNGGAMRIAPLSFVPSAGRSTIRDVVRITHRSDEAYVGALAVVLAIRSGADSSSPVRLERLITELPDSRVRDRLKTIASLGPDTELRDVASLGTSGYVVDTVPLALAAAHAMLGSSFETTLWQLIEIDGDIDTIASIAGQIYGARVGCGGLPESLLAKLPERAMVERIAREFAASV